jgi:hypothetical protein
MQARRMLLLPPFPKAHMSALELLLTEPVLLPSALFLSTEVGSFFGFTRTDLAFAGVFLF